MEHKFFFLFMFMYVFSLVTLGSDAPDLVNNRTTAGKKIINPLRLAQIEAAREEREREAVAKLARKQKIAARLVQYQAAKQLDTSDKSKRHVPDNIDEYLKRQKESKSYLNSMSQ